MRLSDLEGTKLGDHVGGALLAASKRVEWICRKGEDLALELKTHSIKYLFEARPDDIFIATYPRSGTTWVQMILHQLVTSGDMSFGHISEFSPYFELGFWGNRRFDISSPRVFKTHLAYRHIPHRPCRYVYVTRDVRDVVISCFNHERTRSGFHGSFDQFFAQFMDGEVRGGSWYCHVEEWFSNSDHLNVLFLTYEELSRDLEGSIRRIAAFLTLSVDEKQLPSMVDRCRFEFMRKNESKFDPILEPKATWTWQPGQFVREGKAGAWKQILSDTQALRMRTAFDERVRQARLPRYVLSA